MSLPVGVETRTVQLQVPLDALGNPPKVYAGTVQPDRTIVWAATSDRLWPSPAQLPAVADGYVSFQVPIVDQVGWVDANGNPVQNWAYRLVVRATWEGSRRAEARTFQVFDATPDPVEIELLPSGSTMPVESGDPYVSSFLGHAGALTGPVVDDALAEWFADPGSSIRQALDELYIPEGWDVVGLLGQSDMGGKGTPLDLTYLDAPDPDIQQWAGSGAYLGQQVAAVDPLLHHNVVSSTVGPGMSFAKWWKRRTGRRVLLVPVAHGATGFRTTSVTPAPAGYHYVAGGGSWDPDATDGGTNLYDYAVSQLNAAIASDAGNRLVAVLWEQGSGDSAAVGGTLNAAQYKARTLALIDGIRSEVTGADDVPFLLGRTSYDAWYDDHPADVAIMDATHLSVPVAREFTAWSRAGAAGQLEADGIHKNAAEQRRSGGVYYAEAFEVALWNELGAGAPDAPTDLTAVQSGTTLIVSWSRPLSRVTSYTLEYNAGSGWVAAVSTGDTDTTYTLTGQALGSNVQVRVYALNEDGTSPASDAAVFALKNTPAVPTGLAVTPGAWSADVSWNPVAGATSYTLEYKKTADVGWTSVVLTGTSKRISALLVSTSYDYRVKATNEAGSSAATATTTTSTTAATYLNTDAGANPLVAYSVRKIRSSYAGSCLRVRRSSDSTEQDIGFDANGLLDVAAITAFVGANTGTVAKWYNQGSAGATYDVLNATTAQQPTIRTGGAGITHNGLPALSFDGVNDFLAAGAPGILASAAGAVAMAVAQTRDAGKALFTESAPGGNPRWSPLYVGPGGQTYFIVGNDLGQLSTFATAVVTDDNSLNQETVIDTTTAATIRRNGVATSVNGSAYSRVGTYTPTNFQIGTTPVAGTFHAGKISELVIWNVQLTDPTTAEANQRGYFATA